MVLGARPGLLDAEAFELGRVGFEPAGGSVRSGIEAGGEVVFGGAPPQHVKLQRADRADDPVPTAKRLEHAGHPLLGQLLEGVLQML
jgi:hypothetical protein